MVRKDIEEKEVMKPWPDRGTKENEELEEALGNIIDWGRVSMLRFEYPYPALILSEDPDKLAKDISIYDANLVREVQLTIKNWSKDPEGFKSSGRMEPALIRQIPRRDGNGYIDEK